MHFCHALQRYHTFLMVQRLHATPLICFMSFSLHACPPRARRRHKCLHVRLLHASLSFMHVFLYLFPPCAQMYHECPQVRQLRAAFSSCSKLVSSHAFPPCAYRSHNCVGGAAVACRPVVVCPARVVACVSGICLKKTLVLGGAVVACRPCIFWLALKDAKSA